MSLITAYQDAKRLYDKQKALAPYEGLDPNRAQQQLRMDISSVGVSVAAVTGTNFRFINNYTCQTYRASITRALQEVRANTLLKSGSSLILTLWPEDIRLDVIAHEFRQNFSSISQLDKRLQLAPNEFRLASGYVYRVLTQGWPQAECMGLKLEEIKPLEDILPLGVLIRRYWGPLAALDTLMSHFYSLFTREVILVAILDASRIHYFKLEKGLFASVRIADRDSLKNPLGLKKILQDFSMPKSPQVYMIDLGATSHDVSAFCAEVSQKEHVNMNLVDRAELMQSFNILAAAERSSLFPLAMLEGSKDGRF
ncbi:MAG: hypothetical protein ACOY3I_02150 [Verrucomicrobiota bacterium]